MSASGRQAREALAADRRAGAAELRRVRRPRTRSVRDMSGSGPIAASPGIGIGPEDLADRQRVPTTAADAPPARPAAETERLHAAIEAARAELSATRDHVASAAGEHEAEIFDAHLLLLDDDELVGAALELIAARARHGRARLAVGGRRARGALRSTRRPLPAIPGGRHPRRRRPGPRSPARRRRRRVHRRARRHPRGVRPDTDPGRRDSTRPRSLGIVTAAGQPGLPRRHPRPRRSGYRPSSAPVDDVLDRSRRHDDPRRRNGRCRRRSTPTPTVSSTTATRPTDNASTPSKLLDAAGRPGDHRRRCAHRGPRQHRVARRRPRSRPSRRRRRRLAPHRVPLPRPSAATRRRRAARGLPLDRRGPRGPAAHRAHARRRRRQTRSLPARRDRSQPVPRPAVVLRLSLQQPDIFKQQLRALVRAGMQHPISVLFPMVTTIDELRAARAHARRRCRRSRTARRATCRAGFEVGAMAEVPAFALHARAAVPLVDLISIGTNDLTQYTLAAERGNADVAALADSARPRGPTPHLRSRQAAATARARVAVCGELAADPDRGRPSRRPRRPRAQHDPTRDPRGQETPSARCRPTRRSSSPPSRFNAIPPPASEPSSATSPEIRPWRGRVPTNAHPRRSALLVLGAGF